MQQRSTKLENIDLGSDYYTHEEYRGALAQLGRIGRFLGGDRATLKAFQQHCDNPKSILDVGCGGGFFTAKLARRYPQAQVVGIDTSQDAISYAKEQGMLANLNFEYRKDPRLLESSNSYDVVTSTLVCHHLSDEDLINFLKRATQVAKKAVILNDLHRHLFPYLGFSLIAPILFPNRLIWYDGRLSIKRAFKRSDWERYLEAAGISKEHYEIKWRWAFRWVITIKAAK